MMRFYCDDCDRDISHEPRVALRVDVPLNPPSSKIKPGAFEWCLMCAKAHGIKIEEYED